MSESNQCPECGAELPSGATEGLCPKCLMGAGLGSGDEVRDDADNSPFAVTTPQTGGFVPPHPEELIPLFPQLEILELLGHGGMGAVYKARQTKLDRLVALKIIRPESADDPTFAERFMREARTLARLNHPHIVAVHDFGETGELYYFLMEYVDGLNLRQIMHAGELQPEQTLAIVPQICEALQFAHDEGIIHRDIKPENILVDSRGRVKIADFGLARIVSSSPQDFTLTGTHQVMGTPRYMAPEQMEGSHQVDHRADIYSLGVVFYEMLTGEIPMGQFDPPSRKAAVDARLDDIVLRALAREPERRYQQAGEIKTNIEMISSHPGSDVSSPHREITQQPANFSSIVEREAHNILRWVTGSDEETKDRQPQVPTLLMLLMSLAGIGMLFLPWLDLEIPGASLKKTYYGTDRWPAFTASVAFGCLAMMLIAFPAKRRMSIGRALLMTALPALAVLHTFLFKGDLESGSIRPFRNVPATVSRTSGEESFSKSVMTEEIAITEETEEPAVSDSSELLSRPLYLIEHHITYREGFYGSLSLSIGLLLLNVIGIRHAIAARNPNQPKTLKKKATKTEGIQNAHIGFKIPGIDDIGAHVVSHFSLIGYRVFSEQPGEWVFHRGKKSAALWETDIRLLLTTLTVRSGPQPSGGCWVSCGWDVTTLGMAGIIRKDIAKLEAEGRELETLLRSASLPVLKADIAIDTEKPVEFQQAITPVKSHATSPSSVDIMNLDLEMLRMQVRGPALGLMITGILAVLFWIVRGAFVYRASGGRFFEELSFATLICGLITLAVLTASGLLVLGAVKMRAFRSYELCMAASILAIVPWSFAALLGVPIGIWALRVLRRKEIKAAFVRESLRPREPRSERTRFSRKAIIGMLLIPACVVNISLGMYTIAVGPDIPGMFLGLSGLVISILTTFLGIVAISDIRHSEGRLTGLGLAFFDAVFFPTLVLNALMIVGPVVGLGMSKYISWALLVTVLIAVLVDVFVLRLLWRKVTATEGNLLKTGVPTPVVHETPKPRKRKPSGWFVLVLVLVSLVVFFLIIGSLLWLVSYSGVETPATIAPPQDAMSQRENWVLGPDGPALTYQFARRMKLQSSQHQQVNKILQDIYREYLVLLEQQTQRTVNAAGHHVTTVTPFPKEITKLEEKLWGRLDPLLDREQQNLFRLNLPLHPVRRSSYSGGSIHDRGIFGFGDDVFQIEIWRVGEWFHWRVQDKEVWPGSYPPGSSLQKTPELPEAFRRWWKEPAEEGNQNDAPD